MTSEWSWPASRVTPDDGRTYNDLEVRFSATLGEEPEIEVGLVYWLDARVLITRLRAIRAFSEFVPRAKLS